MQAYMYNVKPSGVSLQRIQHGNYTELQPAALYRRQEKAHDMMI